MPIIQVQSGALNNRQKEELIQRLTKEAAKIMEIPEEFFTVTLQELPDANFGIGGKNIERCRAEYRR